MDDDEAQEQRARDKARSRIPQHKYRDLMQELADRKIDEVMIDLDDLANAGRPSSRPGTITDFLPV